MSYAQDYLGKSTPKLGFGLMRLPKLDDGTYDDEQIKKMVDHFMEAGLTYFDTAYVYDNGGSEEAARRCLVERHPRESYTLATKVNAMAAADEVDAKQQILTSLERTGAGYFDFYLLHALQENNHELYDKYHLWDYQKQLKEEGKIRHMGFSFHAKPDLLEHLLDTHPEVEFVQLQVNYADWEDPVVCAQGNVEVCQAHGVPFTIMEPIKGGSLAVPPEPVQKVFDESSYEYSYPTWAVRFAASHEGVLTVLSGMSTLAQLEENVSFMRDFKPFDAGEYAVVERAMQAMNEVDMIRCTACHYCTKGCPQQIHIPEIFEAMNRFKTWHNEAGARDKYARETPESKASDCIGCGQCEAACPQRLPIIELLQECAATFD